jgi:hypothetical protein
MYVGLMMLDRLKYIWVPLVPEPSVFETEVAVQKLQSHKPAGTDHMRLEFIQA